MSSFNILHFHYQYWRMFYSSLPTEDIAKLLDSSQSNMWQMGSQCSFNCHFLLWAKQNIFPYFPNHLHFYSLWALCRSAHFFSNAGTFFFPLFLEDLNIFSLLHLIYHQITIFRFVICLFRFAMVGHLCVWVHYF